MELQPTRSLKKPALSDSPLQRLIDTEEHKNPVQALYEKLQDDGLIDEQQLIRTVLSPLIQETVELGDLELERMHAAQNFLLVIDGKPSPVLILGF